MYKNHTVCRACGRTELTEVFDLGVQPLANDFVPHSGVHRGYAPLKLMWCPYCTLAQLSVVVNPEILYSNYPYVTSRSNTMQVHFGNLWSAIKQECSPDSIVEIGSNDGHFLKFCKDHGASAVMGIDPASNLKPETESGIISVCGMFDEMSANIARSAMPKVDVIMARHVFAHIDDWHGFVKNLDILASKDTLIVIEVPYLLDTIQNVELDQCYHEHLSYVSVESVAHLLDHTPFYIHRLDKSQIHGGAIVLMLRRRDSEKADKGFSIYQESITPGMWFDFARAAQEKIKKLRQIVHSLVTSGKTVCGYGASAKSTVWISACGFTRREISFICDCTPQKQGTCSPGTDIPIAPEIKVLSSDYAVLFSWNFSAEIVSNNRAFLDSGGHFIIPGKEIEII